MVGEWVVIGGVAVIAALRVRRVVRARQTTRSAAVARAFAVLDDIARTRDLGAPRMRGRDTATVTGTIDGVAVEVEVEHDGRRGRTRFLATPRAPLPFTLRALSVDSLGFADAFEEPIEPTGDAAFDARFVVHTISSVAKTSVLGDELRALLLLLAERGATALHSSPSSVTLAWRAEPDAALTGRTLDVVASLGRGFETGGYR